MPPQRNLRPRAPVRHPVRDLRPAGGQRIAQDVRLRLNDDGVEEAQRVAPPVSIRVVVVDGLAGQFGPYLLEDIVLIDELPNIVIEDLRYGHVHQRAQGDLHDVLFREGLLVHPARTAVDDDDGVILRRSVPGDLVNHVAQRAHVPDAAVHHALEGTAVGSQALHRRPHDRHRRGRQHPPGEGLVVRKFIVPQRVVAAGTQRHHPAFVYRIADAVAPRQGLQLAVQRIVVGHRPEALKLLPEGAEDRLPVEEGTQ